jgi:RNA polymerase sigma-70 factor (ECF subfamily)
MLVPRPIAESVSSEHEQIARIRAGDERAFEALFMAYYSPLRDFVSTYLDRATGEELLQELFLTLWRKRETWNPAGGVRAYLFAAVRNRALNVLRKRRVAARASEQLAADEINGGAGQSNATPAQELSVAEVEVACRSAIHELPESNRVVMALRWNYGMSHAEIAFVVDTSIKGVEAQLARGLRLLATRLAWLRA